MPIHRPIIACKRLRCSGCKVAPTKGYHQDENNPYQGVGTGLAPVRAARGRHVAVHSPCACHHLSDRGQPCPYGENAPRGNTPPISAFSGLFVGGNGLVPVRLRPIGTLQPFGYTHTTISWTGASPVPTVGSVYLRGIAHQGRDGLGPSSTHQISMLH